MLSQMKDVEQVGETFQILSRRTCEQKESLIQLADEMVKSIHALK